MKKVLVLLIIVSMVMVGLFANGSSESSSSSSGPIKVGSIMDLSGSGAANSRPNAWGVEYAVKVLNENGGINGRPIELTTLDCKNDAAEGVSCYRKLVDEIGVSAIIGPPLSNPAAAWVELSAEDEIPIVGHFMDDICTTNPETGEVYKYMFLVEPSSAVQGRIMAKYTLENLGDKRVAVLYNPGNAFAKSQAAPFIEYVNSHGGEVVAEETFTWTDKDYSAQALKIINAKPDAVFVCDYLAQNIISYDALRDAGFTGDFVGANTVAPPFQGMVKNKVENVYFLQNYDMLNSELGNINELVNIHMKETNTNDPSVNVGFGWDAIAVLADAMKKAKDPTDGVELASILENTKNVALSGGVNVTLDPTTHRPTSDMGMYIADYDDNLQIRILDYITVEE